MATIFAPPYFTALDSHGAPVLNATLTFYASGTDDIATVYTDALGLVPAPSPIRTDSAGRAPTIFLGGDAYRLIVRNAAGVIVRDIDPLNGDTAIAAPTGSSLVGFLQAGTAAVARNVQAKARETLSVQDFGAVGDYNQAANTGTDDTLAIQAAYDACPQGGTVYFPPTNAAGGPARYRLTDAIRIVGSKTTRGGGTGTAVQGPGVSNTDAGSYVIQTNLAKNAFTLVPTLANYAFAAYGILDTHFADICIRGMGVNTGSAGIGADTTINGGNFHIRENSMTNVLIKYFNRGVDYTGIAYLNIFTNCKFMFCGKGFNVARGAASDKGGQSRWFGCLFEFNQIAASLNEDTTSGDFSFFGCTFADGGSGIRTNDEAQITAIGCHFETLNATGGNGVGIYVLTAADKSNPNSGGNRTIIGNSFNANDVSIIIEKATAAGSDGNYNYPAFIQSNNFGDPVAVKFISPPGHLACASHAFVFGSSNTGLSNTFVSPSQLIGLGYINDERKRRVTRRYTFTGAYGSGDALDVLPAGMVPVSVRLYLTANASGFTTFTLGDPGNSARYASFNANTQTLNTWVNWTPPVPQFVVDGATNAIRLIGSSGILGAAGVIEVDGYLP